MYKLLNKFEATRELKDAVSLTKYLAKHTMAECMLDGDGIETLSEARALVMKGAQ